MSDSARTYQVCTRCIMDTTDPGISFDENGVCSHCHTFETVTRNYWFPNDEGKRRLEARLEEVKAYGRNREYDCILGLSGGVDSSYVAYQAVQLGLRPLAVHVDAGWNSETAVKNIENIVVRLEIDLYTHVMDWEDMQDLQFAYFRAGVPNQDVPQDHCFTSILYRTARKHGIKYVLNGSNYATECILPRAWGYNCMDAHSLKAIHKRFGNHKLRSYPTTGFFDYYLFYPHIYGIKVIRPLNFMPYVKNAAMQLLHDELEWEYYGGKHYESRFTKFFQAHLLPTKFGFDKRRAHLSSMVVNGLISRAEAEAEMGRELYNPTELAEDREYFIKKLGITETEYDAVMRDPPHSHRDYPNNEWLFQLKNRLVQRIGRSR